MSSILKDVVHAINNTLRHELSWSRGEWIQQIEEDFYNLCNLLGIMGAIDGTHVSISKPQNCLVDYFYFKSRSYMLNCQAIVDNKKRFFNLYLRMLDSTNDSRMLRHSSLYELGSCNMLLDDHIFFKGFSPYLIGD